MSLTLPACQMNGVDPAGARGNLGEGAAPDEAEAGGVTGGEGTTAPAEPVAPAPDAVTTACDAGVWTGDYTVGSQSDLDALAGYTEVTGTLRVEESSIVHLAGPGCLVTVGGDIRIVTNAALRSVSGFDGLRTVGGRLGVFDNYYLGSISGFGELRAAGGLAFSSNAGALVFEGLPPVLVIEGFDELRTVHGDVGFSENHYRILGFDELELITGRLSGRQIRDVEIYGMNTLSTVGSVRFEETGRVVLDGLTDLERVLGSVDFENVGMLYTTGLSDLSVIQGNLMFDESNPDELVILDFPDLERIGGSLLVTESTNVELGSFPALEHIGGDLVIHESAVRDIVGFDELEVIEGDFRVVVAPLERLEGFDDLASIGGDFFLELGVDLVELAAFDDLESIGGDFDLIENFTLASISGFGDLVSIGGNFNLLGNEQLEALGMGQLGALGGDNLSIQYNAALSTCEAEDLLDRLRANGYAGSATIEGNGPCP